MKSFLLKRTQRLNEVIIFLVITFLSFLFEFVGWFHSAQQLSEKISVPALSFSTKVVRNMSGPYDYILFTVNKSKYLKQLESQYSQALSKLNELDSLQKENQELRKLVGARDRKLSDTTIIGAPIVSLAFPAVGVGSSDGVKVSDMVLIDQVLVGTIESVGEYQSRVSLLSNKRNSRILARTESGVEGIIDGDGKNVLLTHIPRNVEITEGERVVAVGQEGIEKNVLIGTVRKIENSPSDATQTFVVSQLVSFYDAVIVEVK